MEKLYASFARYIAATRYGKYRWRNIRCWIGTIDDVNIKTTFIKQKLNRKHASQKHFAIYSSYPATNIAGVFTRGRITIATFDRARDRTGNLRADQACSNGQVIGSGDDDSGCERFRKPVTSSVLRRSSALELAIVQRVATPWKMWACPGFRWANRCIWSGDQVAREIGQVAFPTGSPLRKLRWTDDDRRRSRSRRWSFYERGRSEGKWYTRCPIRARAHVVQSIKSEWIRAVSCGFN